MASKSKKVVALLLTAMVATAAMAGCGGSSEPPKGVSTVSTTSSTSEGSTDSGSSSSTEEGTIDFENAEIVASIKERMKQDAEKNGGKISLKVWSSSDDNQFEKTLADKFIEKFSDSSYELKVKVSGAIGEDAAGGKIIENPEDGADVFNFADDQLSSLVEAGDIAEVATFFLGNVKAENTDDSLEICKVGDEVYAFPKTSDNGYFMYYDKRVFGAEDVGEMDAMIAKAAAQNKAVYLNLGNAWYNTGFFFTAGCTVSYADGKQVAEYGNEKGLSAAKAMCHIAENVGKGFEGTPGTIGDNAFVEQGFKNGTLAAAIIGTWEGPAIKSAIGDENVGAAKLPTVLMDGEQKQLHSFGGYKLIGVNKFSKNPFASQVLAYFLGQPSSQLSRYETRGLIPTAKSALENDKVKDDPALAAITAQKDFAHPQGTSVSGKYWASNVGGLGGEIVTAKGKISDDDLMSKLQKIEQQMS